MRWSGLWVFGVVSLAAAPVMAQVIWDTENITGKKPKFDNSPVVQPSRPDTWPRLDPGAALCKSEADLLRLAAFRRHETTERPNCQIVRSPTPIHISHRAGPGRTQVTLTEQNGGEGWTDAWLPEKAPPSGGKAMPLGPAPR